MNSLNWNLAQLKTELSLRKEIKAWIVIEDHVHRRERYFMNENHTPRLITDQDRHVHSRNVSIKLFVTLSKPGRQGEITKKLSPYTPLKDQIDSAIEAALQTDHQLWELPQEIPQSLPQIRTTDPAMAEDLEGVMANLSQKIAIAAQKQRLSSFNSAELFLSVYHRELHLSNGLIHRSSQSRIYTETAFSYARMTPDRGQISDEYLSTQWAVSLDQLSLEKLFDDTAERAENSLELKKPVTGKYAVLIDAEVLSQLLSGHLSQLSAFNSYSGLPFLKPGSNFIPEGKGDLISIDLDPWMDYGADTTVLSDQGLMQRPLSLVTQNKVMATTADKQFADYLKMTPTTCRGNLVIAPGSSSYEELTSKAPRVIEILQFSGLFTDPNSGTFSSEIRLAKLHDRQKGKVSYIKGGSLSGSIQENFQELYLSKSRTKCVQFGHFGSDAGNLSYFGPEFALLSNVSIVG